MLGNKETVAEKCGKHLADSIMLVAHATYNAPRGRKMVLACFRRLQERLTEIQPKKADSAYRKARYGK